MQLCIRRRDRAATVADYRRVEETRWCELELLPSQEICLLYEMAMRGGYNLREEGNYERKTRPLSVEQSLWVVRCFVCRAESLAQQM